MQNAPAEKVGAFGDSDYFDSDSGSNRSNTSPTSEQDQSKRIVANAEFVWRGLDLHLGRRRRPVLTLVVDRDYPPLYRIRYRNGWTSSPANPSRARDAAYGHARFLMTKRRAPEGATAG